jgi:hypothetical protein
MGGYNSMFLRIPIVLIDQNSPFPSGGPYSPLQRNAPLCGGLPYRLPNTPT